MRTVADINVMWNTTETQMMLLWSFLPGIIQLQQTGNNTEGWNNFGLIMGQLVVLVGIELFGDLGYSVYASRINNLPVIRIEEEKKAFRSRVLVQLLRATSLVVLYAPYWLTRAHRAVNQDFEGVVCIHYY
eukprot:TRINITY_DN50922_c0_g1_i1.p1 TRINITY_DN50922_c0_g1~~TRINITY_DN50922_c0_g1_i1.p1  ORF type:complete len:131 (+),score=17.01 TRINITY_DN50922_c0_g1_i1:290-682(+)